MSKQYKFRVRHVLSITHLSPSLDYPSADPRNGRHYAILEGRLNAPEIKEQTENQSFMKIIVTGEKLYAPMMAYSKCDKARFDSDMIALEGRTIPVLFKSEEVKERRIVPDYIELRKLLASSRTFTRS